MRTVDHHLPQTKRTAKWACIRCKAANSLISILSYMKMVYSSTCSHPITRLKAASLLAFTRLQSLFIYLDVSLNAHVGSGSFSKRQTVGKQCWTARARRPNNKTLIKHKWIQIKGSNSTSAMPSMKNRNLQTWRMKAKGEAIVLRTTSVFIIILSLISHRKISSTDVMEDLSAWTTSSRMLLHIWIQIMTWANSSLKWRLQTQIWPWCHSSTPLGQTSSKSRTSFRKTLKALSITTISNNRIKIKIIKRIQKQIIRKLHLTSVKRIRQPRSRIKRTNSRLNYQREWRIHRSCSRRKSNRRKMTKLRWNSKITPIQFRSRLMMNLKAATSRD